MDGHSEKQKSEQKIPKPITRLCGKDCPRTDVGIKILKTEVEKTDIDLAKIRGKLVFG